MTWSVSPIKHGDRANFNADTVSSTDIPIDSYVCPVDTKLLRRLDWTPNVMAIMLTGNLSILLEIWIYRQSFHPLIVRNG
jgi:hypothetical protein